MRALQVLAILLIAILGSSTVEAKTAHHQRTVINAAENVDVDALSLLTTAHIESRFQPKAQNRRSSAGGMFQFTDRTWRATLRKHGKAYGFGPNTSKHNPRANALMAAHLAKDNADQLRKVLGRSPTPGEVYMAHLLGVGGAIKILKAKPNRMASSLLPSSARGNKKFFYTANGKGHPRTVRQFRNYVNWYFTSVGENLKARNPVLMASL